MSLTLLCSDRVKQVWGSSWASVGEGFGALNASEPQLCLNGSGDWHLLEQFAGRLSTMHLVPVYTSCSTPGPWRNSGSAGPFMSSGKMLAF